MTGSSTAPICRSPTTSAPQGRSSCEELFATAASLGIEALGIVDPQPRLGRWWRPRGRQGPRASAWWSGCRLDPRRKYLGPGLPDRSTGLCAAVPVALLGKKPAAGRVRSRSRWISIALRRGADRGFAVAGHRQRGLRALASRPARSSSATSAPMAALSLRRPNDQLRLFELANPAISMRVRAVVTNDVLFHERQAALSCRTW